RAGGDAATGDADACDMHGLAGVVREPKWVREQRPARDGAEIFGKLVKHGVGPRGRRRRSCQKQPGEKCYAVTEHGALSLPMTPRAADLLVPRREAGRCGVIVLIPRGMGDVKPGKREMLFACASQADAYRACL